MISLELQKAREYEETKEKEIKKCERPVFHLSTRVGWMNDPNGFSFYKGMYHMFYQYHPYDTKWGPMHWGHAISKNLLHWEYLPAALAPDMEYDCEGCFSGSAIELEDGRQLLMYTGVRKDESAGNEGKTIQTQCIAIGDGENYEKYDANPVLDKNDLPADISRHDFRDPKILKDKNGGYLCVVGACDGEKDGCILMYESKDALEWKWKQTLLANHHKIGKMWECPDLFELDGKNVLITSPQDVIPKGYERHNGHVAVCFIAESEQGFDADNWQMLDHGIDFYAPQTVQAPDGRRIMIGWMQNWATCEYKSNPEWFGQMSIPRELSIINGKMIQKPIRELEQLRKEKVSYEKVAFDKELVLEGIGGRHIDLELKWKRKIWVRDTISSKYVLRKIKITIPLFVFCRMIPMWKLTVLFPEQVVLPFIKEGVRLRKMRGKSDLD